MAFPKKYLPVAKWGSNRDKEDDTRRSRGHGNYREKRKAYFAIDPMDQHPYKLNQLADQSPSEVLLTLTDPENRFNELIQQPELSNEIIASVLKVIAKGFASEMHQESLHKLMGMLLASSFFRQHIPIFVSSFITSELDLNLTYSNLLSIYEAFLDRMPNIASEKLNPSILLCANALDMLNKCGRMIDDKYCQRLFNIQRNVEEILAKVKGRKRKQEQGMYEDDHLPPNNFRHLPVIPTTDEIVTRDKPFLRKNITEGKYDDVEHYLDVQFRLLREDFIAPLRQGICDYLERKFDKKKPEKFQDIQVYENVRINEVVCNQGNLLYQLTFDKRLAKRVKWEKSRRLIYGSLLCLSHDDFETIRFASVGNREAKKLKNGIVEVKLENEDGSSSCMTEEETELIYTMVESPAFFEEYRHVLLSLKMINSTTMPFQDYIVHMKTEHTSPSYLRESPVCDLSFMSKTLNNPAINKNHVKPRKMLDVKIDDPYLHKLMKNLLRGTVHIPVRYKSHTLTTDLSTWPSAEDLGLDESQKKAMQLALSSSVAIIQGPPGTGKTYVGYMIVEALIRNYPNVAPILVVCYTNHALDQFLQGILSFTTDLIRVGGRSENVALAPYNLIKKRSTSKHLNGRRRDLQTLLRQCENNIIMYNEDLKSVRSCILREKASFGIPQSDKTLLHNFHTSFQQFYGYRLSVDGSCPFSILAAWLGLTPDNLVDESELQEFYNQEVVESIEMLNVDKETGEEIDNAMDSDNEFVDVEDEVSVQAKNRMVDNDYNVKEVNLIAGTMRKHSDCWAFKLNQMNDLYSMYGLQMYKDSSSKDLQSFIHSDPNAERVLWLRKNYQAQQRHYEMCKTIAEYELALTDAMEDGEVTEGLNVWKLSLRNRWRLYRRWVKFFESDRKGRIEELSVKYKDAGNQLRDITSQQEYSALKNCKIIGMTTTGAARYQKILYEIGCKIVIFEEAAEILESHIISSLNPQTQHLILIGDHLQLRPKPTVYHIAKKFKLEVSLFERLIRNGLPYETLQLQHRMRPEISRLIISHIYPSLLNHPSVHEYPHVLGMKNDIFFISHSEMEQEVADNKSHANKFEAEYLVGLCRYLLQQGYEPQKITILTMYSGQVFTIQRLMPKIIYEGVRVVAVDNYQGEENDIILLSLVRSNEEGKVGFVKIENRINVALSRARCGLYVIGNFQFLAENSDLWKRLMADLLRNHLIGKSLNIICRNHPVCQAHISTGIEFQEYAPEGGCLKKCETQLSCSHICPRACHLDDHGKCTQPCAVRCDRGHPCPFPCYIKCEPCKEIVRKNLPCGHSADMECSTNPEDYDCLELVEITLPYCQHRRNAECYRDVYKVKCLEDCQYQLACGHKCELKCHPNKDPKHIDILCHKACEKEICKEHHQTCTKKCCERCSICEVPVEKTLSCGHKAEARCGSARFFCKEKRCESSLVMWPLIF